MLSYCHNIFYLFVITLCLVIQTGCSPAQDHVHSQLRYPINVTDRDVNTVQLNQPAQRIVCLFEASVDDLYMLGAGEAIVGIPAKIYTSSDLYRAYSILDRRIHEKKIATPSNWEASTNIESVVALQPDLVIVSAGQKDVIQILNKMHIPVYSVLSENLQQTRKELLDLGKLTGKSKRASELVDFIDHEIQSIQQRNHAQSNQKTIYYGWSGGRIFSTSGRDSMPNTVMTLAGARNVVNTAIDQPNVNPEKLIEWNPDVILLWNTNPKQVYQRPELKTLTAVKQQHVFNLSPSFLFNPHTPKILLAANQLNHWVYPAPHSAHAATQDKLRILTQFYGKTAAEQLIQYANDVNKE